MCYHWGLGVGHLYTHQKHDNFNQRSSAGMLFEQPDGDSDQGSDSETVLDCPRVNLSMNLDLDMEDPDDDSGSDSSWKDHGLGSSSSASDLDNLLDDDELLLSNEDNDDTFDSHTSYN